MISVEPKFFSREMLIDRHRLSHQQVDDFLHEKKSKDYLAAKLMQMEQVHEFISIANAFISAGIQFMPLKGPILSYRIYGDASYRRFNDLDFLVDITDVDRAVDFLKESGYQILDFRWPENRQRKKILFKHCNQALLYNPDKNYYIELHWKLSSVALTNFQKQYEGSIEFNGIHFNVFNHEFELLYLVVHGGLHAWRRLKWLVDIQQILKNREIDFEKFNRLTGIYNAQNMVALCRYVLDIYFPDVASKLPAYSCRPYQRNFTLEQIHREENFTGNPVREIWRLLRFRMMAFPGMAYKFSVLKEFLFSPKDLDTKFLPPFALFYYLFMPIGRIRRKLKKRE